MALQPAELHTWFPVSILSVDNILSDADNQQIIDHVLDLKDFVPPGGSNWNCQMYTTIGTKNLVEDPKFKLLVDLVSDYVHSYTSALESEFRYTCKEAWANVAEAGSFQESHFHATHTVSAVYYPSVPVGSGRIIFESPLEPDMLPLKDIRCYNNLTFRQAFYEPKPKRLLVFRSYLRHMVEMGTNTDPRISVAFNF